MPPAQRLVQSGFYEVALTPAFEASLCHATSQNPQDSAKARAPILAAGGILLREGSRPRIAVVRLRRDKSWVLPKGKLYPGEQAVAAARREVMEETGHRVSGHRFLGSMSYAVDGNIKIVQFWHMRAGGGPA